MTKSEHGKVVLITGTSSGLGKACAEHLAARGLRVFGAQRNCSASSTPAGIEAITMDVESDSSVESAVALVLERASRIDAVINNAGVAWMGSIEDTSIAEARAQMETNFFGVLRVCRAVMPIMRRQGGGHIINVSSLAGVLGLPFSGLYSASKFAVEGLTESLRLEARSFNIKVSLVEPGDFRTGLPTARRMTAATNDQSAYHDFFLKIKEAQDKDEADAPAPEAVAMLVEQVLHSRSPKLRYTVGRLAQRIVVPVKRFLPQRPFEWILSQALALPATTSGTAKRDTSSVN